MPPLRDSRWRQLPRLYDTAEAVCRDLPRTRHVRVSNVVFACERSATTPRKVLSEPFRTLAFGQTIKEWLPANKSFSQSSNQPAIQ
eukprot:scaffold380709_cov19-Prasinocladus_malaysianus.AAC.1